VKEDQDDPGPRLAIGKTMRSYLKITKVKKKRKTFFLISSPLLSS
jgi:hypothetical protein